MLGFPLGILYANALEWGIHRWILHGLGRNPRNFFGFHWHEHHRASRKHGGRDPAYERPVYSSVNAQSKELLGMAAIGVLHAPLWPVAPWFSLGLLYSGVNYYRKHKKAHLDPDWAREHLPWHFDHHMGPDQDANWCVTRPWFDQLMGTRKPYLGTPEEKAATARFEKRRARAIVKPAGSAEVNGARTESDESATDDYAFA